MNAAYAMCVGQCSMGFVINQPWPCALHVHKHVQLRTCLLLAFMHYAYTRSHHILYWVGTNDARLSRVGEWKHSKQDKCHAFTMNHKWKHTQHDYCHVLQNTREWEHAKRDKRHACMRRTIKSIPSSNTRRPQRWCLTGASWSTRTYLTICTRAYVRHTRILCRSMEWTPYAIGTLCCRLSAP